jgi:hypothetical protein
MAGDSGMSIEHEPHEPIVDSPLQQALEQALKRSLRAPTVSSDFHARLSAALARDATVDVVAERLELERQHQLQLIELRQGYVRLQLSTLGTWIGAAFTGGVAVTLAMPWLQATIGDYALFAIPLAAGLFVLVIGAGALTQRLGVPRWLS